MRSGEKPLDDFEISAAGAALLAKDFAATLGASAPERGIAKEPDEGLAEAGFVGDAFRGVMIEEQFCLVLKVAGHWSENWCGAQGGGFEHVMAAADGECFPDESEISKRVNIAQLADGVKEADGRGM